MSSTNLEQGKLCVHCPLYMDARLLWEQAICSDSTWCIDDKIEEFPFLITNQVKFESEEPPHGAFSSLRYAIEYLMDMGA